MIGKSSKKKITLLISLIINAVFIIIFIVFILKKGGIKYIQEKLRASQTIDDDNKNDVQQRSYFYDLLENIYAELPQENNEIIFFGDSHFQLIPWNEFFQNNRIKNRGIGGDNLQGLIDRVDAEINVKNPVVFISAGTNDINEEKSVEIIMKSFDDLVEKILEKSPESQIKILTILPIGEKYTNSYEKNNNIKEINNRLYNSSAGKKFALINTYKYFVNTHNSLKEEYSFDDIHLNAAGYAKLKEILIRKLK